MADRGGRYPRTLTITVELEMRDAVETQVKRQGTKVTDQPRALVQKAIDGDKWPRAK